MRLLVCYRCHTYLFGHHDPRLYARCPGCGAVRPAIDVAAPPLYARRAAVLQALRASLVAPLVGTPPESAASVECGDAAGRLRLVGGWDAWSATLGLSWPHAPTEPEPRLVPHLRAWTWLSSQLTTESQNNERAAAAAVLGGHETCSARRNLALRPDPVSDPRP